MLPPMNRPDEVRAQAARPLSVLATLLALASLGNALIAGCGGGGKTDTTGGGNADTSMRSTSTSPSQTAGTTTAGGDLGAQIYAQRCVLCHGPEGKGDGAAAAGLNPKPRNHTDGSYMNAQTDQQLTEVIKNGKGAMPPWGAVLSESEIQAVLKHVRSLAQPPYPGAH
jgi:mono/diheme cytochrome c family protein